MLRYVAAGLAGWPREDPEGPQNQPYPGNLERVNKTVDRLPGDWAAAVGDDALTKNLLALLRSFR